jgi:hypothetical protein
MRDLRSAARNLGRSPALIRSSCTPYSMRKRRVSKGEVEMVGGLRDN